MKVRYEIYKNDYCRKNYEYCCNSLQELEDWIFDQMETDYTKDPYLMFFPTPEILERLGDKYPGRIEFMPILGTTYWIHQIEDPSGILFSDGTFTAGQKHWSKSIQDWLRHCDERKRKPTFAFVD